jgi:hypothetical protein
VQKKKMEDTMAKTNVKLFNMKREGILPWMYTIMSELLDRDQAGPVLMLRSMVPKSLDATKQTARDTAYKNEQTRLITAAVNKNRRTTREVDGDTTKDFKDPTTRAETDAVIASWEVKIYDKVLASLSPEGLELIDHIDGWDAQSHPGTSAIKAIQAKFGKTQVKERATELLKVQFFLFDNLDEFLAGLTRQEAVVNASGMSVGPMYAMQAMQQLVEHPGLYAAADKAATDAMLFQEMIVGIKKYRELHGDIVFETKTKNVGALRARPMYEEQQQTCWTCGDKFKNKKDMYDHVKEMHPDAGKKGGPPGGKFSMALASPVNKDHLTAKANKVLALGQTSFAFGGLQYGLVRSGEGKMQIWELDEDDEDNPAKSAGN